MAKILPDAEAMQILKDTAIEDFFVYVPETDRTRYVLSVVARCSDAKEVDCVDRAVLIFSKDFTREFAVSVAEEIHSFIDDLDSREGRGEPHLRVHINASEQLINSLKHRIIV